MALPMKPGARPFLFRNGTGQFFWKGMSTRTDLGAQPPDRPRLLLNGRVVGGHIMARPPVKTVAGLVPFDHTHDTQPWLPTFLTEHHSYNGVRLWWGGKAHVKFPSLIDPAYRDLEWVGVVGFIDTDYDLEEQAIAAYSHKIQIVPIAERFANSIYVGDYEALRRVYRIQPSADIFESSAVIRAPADEVVASYPGMVTTALHNHEGKLYYAISDPTAAVNGEIWSWDGQQQKKETDLATPGVNGIAMQTYQDSLVVTVRGLGGIMVKSPTGVWTTHTLAGFDSSIYMNSMAELKNKLYIVDGGTKVFSWDGTTLVLERTIATGINPEKVNCCVAFNGRLYYFWHEFVNANPTIACFPWVGMHDPDTTDVVYQWKDDYKYLGTGLNGAYSTRIGTDVHADGDHFVLGGGDWTAAAVYRQRIIAVYGDLTFSHAMENNPYSTWSTWETTGAWNAGTNESPLHPRGISGWTGGGSWSTQPPARYYLKAL
jgi:hypothetical protein